MITKLNNRLTELTKQVDIIQKRMNLYPDGVLKIKTINNRLYYCVADSTTGKMKYLRKYNLSEAQKISQRDYDYNYLKIAEKEIADIKHYLEQNYVSDMEDCYHKIHEGRKSFIQPFAISDEEYVNRWLDMSFSPKEFQEDDDTEYYTDKGERVRSKSEILIANALNSLNIPYKYECPLQLENLTIYPDFTILNIGERRVKYLEHFGRMGDTEYVEKTLRKLNTYDQNGIFLGDSLFCTFESRNKPLNYITLKNKLILIAGK